MSIHLDRASVLIAGAPVLSDLSLEVNVRTTAVIGDNGSGKSTFARLLAGLVATTTGTTRVLGLDPLAQAKELRAKTAFIMSNPDAQILMPTVAEDIAFSLRPERLGASERDARVAHALAQFELTSLAERSSHELSGGQKQLLSLCGAFVRRPALVIADEPTAYLDARNARTVTHHLLADRGHKLVVVTHDLHLAARCEAAVLFAEGRVAAVGPPPEVIATYEDSLRC